MAQVVRRLHEEGTISEHEANLLVYAEGLYAFSTELMRYVEDHDFLQIENTFIRTHSGILLANMRRFREAHRRLNEAAGYLRHSSKARESVPFAVIELRRAEVYLRQAQWVRFETPTDRRVPAYLDDAQYALARAERWLEAQPTSVWWWGLYYELRLTVCCELNKLDVKGCRFCRTIWGCADILKQGQRLVRNDPVRVARLLELWWTIAESRPKAANVPELEEGERILEENAEVDSEMVKEYVGEVLEKLNSLKSRA